MTIHTVPVELDGSRLDAVLAELTGMTRSECVRQLREGRVSVAGVPATKASRKVAAGEVIEIAAGVTSDAEPPPMAELPPIRFRDDDLMVIAKPAGMVVHPGVGNPTGTLVDVLRHHGLPLAPAPEEHRPGIVHRLDKDTSGLMLVASSERAHAALTEQLRRHEVQRHYLALAQGRLPAQQTTVDVPLGRDPINRQRFTAIRGGKAAVTHLQVVGSSTTPNDIGVSLVACTLETGRTHQIRVHLAHVRCPVVGDGVYNPSRAVADELNLSRQFLHAGWLGFVHPITGERVDLHEPLPADLSNALAACALTEPQSPPDR